MRTVQYWVDHLNLQPHPEGGFFKETYRSTEYVKGNGLPVRFGGERTFSTAIYFLLPSYARSLFHRIKSDEIWHFHSGSSLSIYVLDERGLTTYLLGDRPELGESLQIVIPANCWFGALVNQTGSYTLASCTVSPGFDFADFEIAERKSLLDQFTSYVEIIHKLTPDGN